MIRHTQNVAETEQVAMDLAAQLRGGECICLSGELGAGKTQFVRGLLRGLGGSGRSVSSPTFVILNIYDSGRLSLFHIDAYRLGNHEDAGAFDIAELLQNRGVVVIEWPERIAAQIPPGCLWICITATGESSRCIEIRQPAEPAR